MWARACLWMKLDREKLLLGASNAGTGLIIQMKVRDICVTWESFGVYSKPMILTRNFNSALIVV